MTHAPAMSVAPGRPDVGLLRGAAAIVRPRERMRTSEWASRYVHVPAKESDRSGPFDPYLLPWLRALLDIEEETPDKIGLMSYKPSQLGFTLVEFVKIMKAACEHGGPLMYMIGKAEKAEEMSDRRFRDLALNCPPFRAILSEKMLEVAHWSEVEYDRGRIDFYGAGSPSDMLSNPYRWVIGDEFHLILNNTKKWTGEPVTQLIGRLKRQRNTRVSFFGHPTVEDSQFDRYYKAWTDQRAWVWDCPHCRDPVRLVGMDNIVIPTGADGRLKAAGATLVCPCCGKEISDAQRVEAVWEKSERHPRGSGRFMSTIPDDEARSKLMIGIEVHGLCDPGLSVRRLADLYVAAVDDAAKQSLYNYILGQKYTPAAKKISRSAIDHCVPREPVALVPGPTCQGGVRYVTAGVDVQWPKENPWLYCVAIGWAASGAAFVYRRKAQGWAALHAWARDFGVPWRHPDGTQGGTLGILTLAIDAQGQLSGPVKDECRIGNRQCFSVHGNHRVQWLPVQYDPRMKSDEIPWRKVTQESRIVDAIRPELGPLEMYELRRHSWVDRTFGMIQDARLQFVEGLDDELRAHLASNVEQPVTTRHGQAEGRMEWMLPKGLHDDWARAIDYATAAAVIKHQLDLIHQLDAPEEFRSVRERRSRAERRHSEWFPDTSNHWGGL